MSNGKSLCQEGSSAVTQELSSWIQHVTLADVPEEVKTRAKYLILDGLGCALIGARLPWSDKASNSIAKFEEPGKCTVFGRSQASGIFLSAPMTTEIWK